MSNCIWNDDPTPAAACVLCGRPRRLPATVGRAVVRTCTAGKAARYEPPRFLKKLANFTRAALSHALAGAPTCSDEQIRERLTICRGCEHFIPDSDNPEIGECSQCGCPASDRLPKFVSKLAWADQECPVGKWPKLG
jgi:hypothetical protein